MKNVVTNKAIIAGALAIILGMGSVLPVSAKYTDLPPSEEISHKEFTYTVNGVEITGNVPLDEKQLEGLYNQTMNSQSEGEITPLWEDNSDTTVRETEPYYRYVNNAKVRAAADLFNAYFLKKIPKKITSSTWANWSVLRIMNFTENAIKDAYVGSWISSSYNSRLGERRYFATLIHFTDSTYSMPKKIEYWDCTAWYK